MSIQYVAAAALGKQCRELYDTFLVAAKPRDQLRL